MSSELSPSAFAPPPRVVSDDDDAPRPVLRELVTRLCGAPSLEDDEDIFARGYLSSLQALQLLQFIEQRFAIVVEDEDLDFEHFRSINALTRFVERKQAGARAA